MSFSLSNHGWESTACPPSSGSAGYAFDDNDIASCAVGHTITRYTESGGGRFYQSFHTPTRASANDAASGESSEKPLFGKNAIKIPNYYTDAYDTLSLSTVGLESQTYTIGFWLNSTSNAAIEIKSGSHTSNTWILLGYQTNVMVNGAWAVQESVFDVPVDNNWHFVRLVNTNGTMRLYVDGVFKRQWLFAVQPSSLVFRAPTIFSGVSYLRDIVVAKVARDGSLVPANIIGY